MKTGDILILRHETKYPKGPTHPAGAKAKVIEYRPWPHNSEHENIVHVEFEDGYRTWSADGWFDGNDPWPLAKIKPAYKEIKS